MPEIHIELSDLKWESGQGVHTVGKAFLEGDLLKTADLHRSFRSVSSYERFRELVSSLNGQFAVIVTHNDGVWMGVDHIRTHSLFFAVLDDKVYVGDDFPDIDNAIRHKPPDLAPAMEFIVNRYPIGSDTLHPDIKKMRAGEILCVDISGDDITLETEEYFRYRQNPDPIDSEEELLKRMNEALTNAFERTLEVADGRKILLPLSGGYDSRLIAVMLRNLGYDNVHTFCHNLEEDVDIELSKQVAADLNYEWTELNHSTEEIHAIPESEMWQNLHSQIGNYGTLYPSRRHILNLEKISPESNCLLLLGHHAAAPGEFMPSYFESIKHANQTTAIHTIFDYHYNQCLWNRRKYEKMFKSRIINQLPRRDITNIKQVVDALEYWYWRERTPNRMVNPPLQLSAFNKTGWYPLWDKEFVRVFESIPMHFRLGKKLYRKYIKLKYSEICGEWRPTDRELLSSSKIQTLERYAGKILTGTILESPSRYLRNEVRCIQKGDEECIEDLEQVQNASSAEDYEMDSKQYIHWLLSKKYQ